MRAAAVADCDAGRAPGLVTHRDTYDRGHGNPDANAYKHAHSQAHC